MAGNDEKILKEEAQARRKFLKTAAVVGATAPAAALLMSAKPAHAQAQYSGGLSTDQQTTPLPPSP